MTTANDLPQQKMLQDLLNFRREFGASAYAALLSAFGAKVYGQIPESEYANVSARCSAGTAGLHFTAGEDDLRRETEDVADTQCESMRQRLNQMGVDSNASMAARATDPRKVDLKELATGETTADKMNTLGTFMNSARKIAKT